MGKHCFVVVFALVFLLVFPCTAIAETATTLGIEEYNRILEGYLADGMTIEEVAAATYQQNAISFSVYSDNHLKLLLVVIEQELQRRGFAQGEVVVPMGEYIVGEDIPAGVYTVVTGDSYCNLEVYSNGKKIHDYDSFDPETIGKLTLKDGQTVIVKYDSVTFSPYKGLGF